MSVQAFQTRARTIDHLGRGQIADCPTAVSELWKNAYDAYAKRVARIAENLALASLSNDEGWRRVEVGRRHLERTRCTDEHRKCSSACR